MTILLATAGYFLACLLVAPAQQAALMATLAGLSLFGVTRLCRAQPLEAFRWFRSYPLRGLFVLGLTGSILVLGIVYSMGLQVLVQLPLAFLWFWMFAAVDTYFSERRGSRSRE
jgi:TPR repeat protein